MNQKEKIAKEISHIVPIFIRHMYPHVFDPIDVPPTQVLAMVAIEEWAGCTLSELQEEMHVSAPTVSGVINRLVRDKYVKRSIDKNDRRVKNVILTKKGEKVLVQFRSNIEKRWAHILSKMPLEMAEGVKEMLTKTTKGFKDGSI